MADLSDDELLDGMKHVLTGILNRGDWNVSESISSLRAMLKFIDPNIIHESSNPKDLKDSLVALPEQKWNDLVDRLDLESTFPNAKLE